MPTIILRDGDPWDWKADPPIYYDASTGTYGTRGNRLITAAEYREATGREPVAPLVVAPNAKPFVYSTPVSLPKKAKPPKKTQLTAEQRLQVFRAFDGLNNQLMMTAPRRINVVARHRAAIRSIGG